MISTVMDEIISWKLAEDEVNQVKAWFDAKRMEPSGTGALFGKYKGECHHDSDGGLNEFCHRPVDRGSGNYP